jgi:hypothetical protein
VILDIPDDFVGDAIAYYNLAKSIESYENTEDGDMKALAGGNVVASVATMINPVVGGILNVVLFVAGVFMSAMAIRYQTENNKIMGDTLKEYQTLLDVNMQQAKAEAKVLGDIFESANSAMKRSKAHRAHIAQSCSNKVELKDTKALYDCLRSLEGLIVYHKQYIEEMSRVFDLDLKYVPITGTLESLGFSMESIQKQMTQNVRSLEKSRADVKRQMNQLVGEYVVNKHQDISRSIQDGFSEGYLKRCRRVLVDQIQRMSKYDLEADRDKKEGRKLLSHLKSSQVVNCLEQINRYEMHDAIVGLYQDSFNNFKSSLSPQLAGVL